MAEFKSHYKSLGFYVNGEFKKFADGRYVTDDAKTIEVLTSITDAQRVDEPKVKPEAKPAPKAPTRKPSAK